MKAKKTILWLALLCAAASGAVWADGGGHRHHHHGPRVGVGVYFGVPFGYPYPFGRPWYVPPPHYYYPGPPVVIVRPPEPQVYIERAASQPAPLSQAYWHYCSNPPGYYPYVRECPGGWMQVVPTPPSN